jgi:hypothetical protein
MTKLVLIGGMPRSGTNLIRRIVGSHSKIAIPPYESQFPRQFVAGKSVESILRNGRVENWDIDLTDLYSKSHKEAFSTLLVRYASSIGKEIPGEKSPHNEFYYEIIQEWLEDFELKFVHVVRNPFDETASQKHFHEASFRKDKRKAKSLHVPSHCRNWARSASMGLARARYHPEGYYLLKYEDLATYPTDTIRELCTFLGVDFEQERMLNLADFEGHGNNTSFQEQQAKKHPEFSAIRLPASRKHYLTASEIRAVASICGELARALGYRDNDLQSLPPEHPPPTAVKRLRRAVSRRVSGWKQ